MIIALFVGFVFGWVGSIPVAGPISALVVARGIEGRFRAGVFLALGGGIAEALYAFLAFWGFSTYLTQYPIVAPVSALAAAIILAVLGVTFARTPAKSMKRSLALPKDEQAKDGQAKTHRYSDFGQFILGVSICALNPTLIATWGGVVAILHSSKLVVLSSQQALSFAVGCSIGIAGWFTTLLWIIRKNRDRFSPASLSSFMRWMGVGLIALSCWFAWQFVAYAITGR